MVQNERAFDKYIRARDINCVLEPILVAAAGSWNYRNTGNYCYDNLRTQDAFHIDSC